ncbi:MAG: hypothetical protein WAM60_10335 [Candidatus Promineifilaceae bacterium]
MSQQNVELVIGRLATDGAFRNLFFCEVEEAITGYELNPVEADTLQRMAGCPVTRASSAAINKSHAKYAGQAREAAIVVG